MTTIEARLQERMQKKQTGKMTDLAHRASQGELSSFAGMFSVSSLEPAEIERLRLLLELHAQEGSTPELDLGVLVSLTAEVKALNHQAALLHGERIQKVHTLLIGYREGAFTAWLIAAYGNRQTPYNLLRYYEFYQALPKDERTLLERMPRQAIYTLSTRQAPFERKQQFVLSYKGETKHALLARIRREFPLEARDNRAEDPVKKLLSSLEDNLKSLCALHPTLTHEEALRLTSTLATMQGLLMQSGQEGKKGNSSDTPLSVGASE